MKVLAKLARLPEWLNWLLSVVEPLLVFGIIWLIGYGVILLFSASESQHAQIVTIIKVLNDNWKAGLILLLVLFYRTIRIFLEQAEQLWGVKKQQLPGREVTPSSPESQEEQR
jgi:hypothetical protein